MLKSKRNLISFILILILFITLTSCRTIYIEPVPETLPGAIEKIKMETIDFSQIPIDQEKKIIINAYAAFMHDIRWRVNHYTGLLINGNLTPDSFNDAVKPLYEQLAAFNKKFEDLKASIRDPPE